MLNNSKDKILGTKNPEPELEPEPTVFDTPKPTNQQTKKSTLLEMFLIKLHAMK